MRRGGLRGQDGRVGHEACSLTSLHVQLTLKRWRGNEHRSERISEDVGEKLRVAHSEKKMRQVWKQGFLWGLLLFSSIRTGQGTGEGRLVQTHGDWAWGPQGHLILTSRPHGVC